MLCVTHVDNGENLPRKPAPIHTSESRYSAPREWAPEQWRKKRLGMLAMPRKPRYLHELVICGAPVRVKDRLAIVLGIRRASRLHTVLKTYFVRKAVGREVVGLFAAPSLRLLAALVDECCDPTACEYAPVHTGGLLVPAATGATWPLDGTDAGSGLEGAILSQQWQDDLSRADSTLDWKPLAGAARAMIASLGR